MTDRIQITINATCDRTTLAHIETALGEYLSQHTVKPFIAEAEIYVIQSWLRDLLSIGADAEKKPRGANPGASFNRTLTGIGPDPVSRAAKDEGTSS